MENSDRTPVKKKKVFSKTRRKTPSSASSEDETDDTKPELNFRTFSTLSTLSPLSKFSKIDSILSPRRSARLLSKHNDEWRDATSDYGTASYRSCRTGGSNVQDVSVLSDEISTMSIDDLLTPKIPHPYQVDVISLNSIYVLLPHKITPYDLRQRHDFKVEFIKETQPYLEKLNVYENYCEMVKISSNNYDFSLSPLISIPFLLDTDIVNIYLVNMDGNLQLVSKSFFHNFYVNFYIEKEGTYLLVPRSLPVVFNGNVSPEEGLELGTEGIQVLFPKGSVQFPIFTEMKIHYDNLIEDEGNTEGQAPAAPVIELSPSSITFAKPIEITLEIVNYSEILLQFPSAKLSVYQCCDNKSISIDFKIEVETEKDSSPNTKVKFSVAHFSYFKTVWNLVTTNIGRFGLGLSNLFSKAQNIRCQATMDEYENDRFGLEVSVFSADKNFPDVQNYSHDVGRSLPKLVRYGPMVVCLKSSLFEADVDAGEEEDMVKTENFAGVDFNVQFALKFKGSVGRGPFGKVLIKRVNTILFDLNVQKIGNEGDVTEQKENQGAASPNRWSIVFLEELATNLFITDGDNWKLFAKHLGFTKQEINNRFRDTSDPFRLIIEVYKSRGGTPEEVRKSLYEIHREIRLNQASGSPQESISSRLSNRSGRSSGLGSSVKPLKPFQRVRRDSSSSEDELRSRSKGTISTASQLTGDSLLSKRKRNKVPKRKPKRKKRRKGKETEEDTEEQTSSSEQEIEKIDVASKHNSSHNSEAMKNDTRVLENQFMWDFSQYLHSTGWKALGRTLLVEESTLISIEQSHRANGGNRECFYQVFLAWKEHYPKKCTFGNLYKALVKEKMDDQAKKMKRVYDNADYL